MLTAPLKKYLKNLNVKYWLLFIVVVAFLLRVNRIDIGFPALFVSNDEAILHQSALNMLANHTPFTLGNYGPLGSYIQLPFLVLAFLVMQLSGAIHGVKELELLLLTQEGYLLFIPRLISVLFGVLCVLIVYKISNLLFKDKKAALWSAFFAAVSFNLVHISHLARAWSPAIFFMLLAVFLVIKSINNGQGRFTVLSFISAALAFGFHQLSGLGILLIISICLLSPKTIQLKFLGIGFALWLGLIIVFNHFSLGGNFWTVLAIGNSTSTGLTFFPKDVLNIGGWLELFGRRINFAKVFLDLILTDGVITLLAIYYLLTSIRSKISLIIWSFILFSFLLVSFVFPPYIRYFFTGFSFLPIFAGYSMSILATKTNKIIVFSVILLSSLNSLYWNFVISQPATFEQLTVWVQNSVRPEEMILIQHRRNFSFVPSKKAASIVRTVLPGYYSRASKVIGDSYPANVRDVIYLESMGQTGVDGVRRMLTQTQAKYIISSYYFLASRLPLEKDGLILIKHFSPTGNIIYGNKIPEALFDAPYFMPIFQLKRAGPYIDVFKIV